MVFSLECWGLLKLSKVTFLTILNWLLPNPAHPIPVICFKYFQIFRIISRDPKEPHGICIGGLGSCKIIQNSSVNGKQIKE